MKLSKRFDAQFTEIVKMIHQAQYNAIKSVNTELVKLYWDIGKYVSDKLSSAEWGDSVVDRLADYIQLKHPEFKGFTRRGLYRMRQFYDTYHQKGIVSAVLTQISWTNHLLILSKTKTKEEREFYLMLSMKEKYSSRELERQIDSGYYERAMLSKKKVSPLVTKTYRDIRNVFKDTYVLDFLNLPKSFTEKDLQKSIVSHFRDFILEFGKDFTLVGQEYNSPFSKGGRGDLSVISNAARNLCFLPLDACACR